MKALMTFSSDNQGLNASFAHRSAVNPPLTDYIAFHGMLISPAGARRCVDSFNGVVLFAEQAAYDNHSDLKNFDYNRTPLRLTVWSYYLLVAFSLTGLCSLLGQTRLLISIDSEDTVFFAGEEEAVDSIEIQNLRIPAYAISYVIQRANDQKLKSAKPVQSIKLTRRFEYNFGGFLSVMMVHFVCCNGRKHLIEVYRVENSVLGFLTKALLMPLKITQSFFDTKFSKFK
jgi:hypothetical protein